MPEKVLQDMLGHTAGRASGQPDDIAHAYLFLASDEAGFINGAVLSVDGGVVLARNGAEMTIGDWLARRDMLTPHKVALIDAQRDYQPITYREWNRTANRTANFLRELGVRQATGWRCWR